MNDAATKPKRTRQTGEAKPRQQGMNPTEAREKLTAIFHATGNGKDFAAALAAAGFQLVKTTRRVLQVIDRQGAAHTLVARIAAPAADIEKRLADIPAEAITPKKTREREDLIKCFVSPSEKADIEARAERAGLSVSGYLRALAFGKDTQQPRAARRPPMEKETLLRLLAELGKIGSNVNQIAHAMNAGKITDHPALALFAVEIRDIRQQLKTALGREPVPNKKPDTPKKNPLADKLFGKGKAA